MLCILLLGFAPAVLDQAKSVQDRPAGDFDRLYAVALEMHRSGVEAFAAELLGARIGACL